HLEQDCGRKGRRMNSPIITLQKIVYWEADRSGSPGCATHNSLRLRKGMWIMRPLLTLVLGIIGLMLASWCFAGVDHPSLVTDPSLITLINTTGDDVFATTNLTTLIDPTTNATQHYGPYNSTSTDSGTCGTDWANDTFDRHFTVRRNQDGSFLVVEQFKDGSFTTPAADSPPVNFSPGACQNGPTPQGIVNAGVIGSLHGYVIIPGVTTQTSMDPHCNATLMTNANCDTMTFINT